MDNLRDLANKRDAILSYLQSILSPELKPDVAQDSTTVTPVYLTLSRPSNDKWMVNNN